MAETKYMVLEGNTIMARDMTLETALMLVCGIAEKYWREPDLEIIIHCYYNIIINYQGGFSYVLYISSFPWRKSQGSYFQL